MKYKVQRLLAILMTLIMVFEYAPTTALADGDPMMGVFFNEAPALTPVNNESYWVVASVPEGTTDATESNGNWYLAFPYSSDKTEYYFPINGQDIISFKSANSKIAAQTQGGGSDIAVWYYGSQIVSNKVDNFSFTISKDFSNNKREYNITVTNEQPAEIAVQLQLVDSQGQQVSEIPDLKKPIYVKLEKTTDNGQGILYRLDKNDKGYYASISQIFNGPNDANYLIDFNNGDTFNISIVTPNNADGISDQVYKLGKSGELHALSDGETIADIYGLNLSQLSPITITSGTTSYNITATMRSDVALIRSESVNNPAYFNFTVNNNYPQETIEKILGNEWVRYGIIANTWYFAGDAETSIAVGNIISGGGQNGSNSSKSYGSDSQFWLVGGFEGTPLQVKGYHLYLTSPSSIFENHQIYFDPNNSDANTAMITHEPDDGVADKISNYIDDAITLSNTYAGRDSFTKEQYKAVQQKSTGKLVIDLRYLPDNQTYYFNYDQLGTDGDWTYLKQRLSANGEIIIQKKVGQKIVFNIPEDGDFTVSKYLLYLYDSNNNLIRDYDSAGLGNSTSANNYEVVEDIIYNYTGQGTLSIDGTAGVFLAPKGEIKVTTSSGGWAICNTMRAINGQEWHYIYHKITVNTSVELEAEKKVLPAESTIPEDTFTFRLTPISQTTYVEGVTLPDFPYEYKEETVGSSKKVKFEKDSHSYQKAGTYIYTYEIREVIPGEATADIPGVGSVKYDNVAEAHLTRTQIRDAAWKYNGYQYDPTIYTVKVYDLVSEVTTNDFRAATTVYYYDEDGNRIVTPKDGFTLFAGFTNTEVEEDLGNVVVKKVFTGVDALPDGFQITKRSGQCSCEESLHGRGCAAGRLPDHEYLQQHNLHCREC